MTAIGAFNCRHLRYVWVVAKAGGVAQAGEQLHLTLPSISGQLSVQHSPRAPMIATEQTFESPRVWQLSGTVIR